jgi:hypothetical protein
VAAAAAASDHKTPIPYGYQRVVLANGEERFCRNDLITGSRTEHQKVCMTAAQLEASQKNSQDFINGVQQHGTTSSYSGAPGAGGALGR